MDKERVAYDVKLQVAIKEPSGKEATVVCRSNLKYLYWNFRQQLAHHTINGCNMRSGDLCGTGTISGVVNFVTLFNSLSPRFRVPIHLGQC